MGNWPTEETYPAGRAISRLENSLSYVRVVDIATPKMKPAHGGTTDHPHPRD